MAQQLRLAADLLDQLIDAAVQAPSSHNTQPWLFRHTASGIDVLADRTRRLPVNDPDDRELTISCGAALYNLEMAAHHHGLEPRTVLLPDPDDSDVLATVSMAIATTSPNGAYPSLDTLGWRRTTRGPLVAPEDPGRLRNLVPSATDGVSFVTIDGTEREQIARLVADGDRAQFGDRRWRRELAGWMHPRRHGDGLVVPEVLGLATKAVVTAFDLGDSTARKDVDLVHAAPLLVLVASDRDDAEAWLRTGQALQAFLLRATSRGLAGGYLNQPCQLPDLRLRLQEIASAPRFPQLLIRIGVPTEPVRPTPRRPIQEVLVHADLG